MKHERNVVARGGVYIPSLRRKACINIESEQCINVPAVRALGTWFDDNEDLGRNA